MRSNWTVSTYFVYIIYFCFLIIPHKSLTKAAIILCMSLVYTISPRTIPWFKFNWTSGDFDAELANQGTVAARFFFFKSMIFLIRNFSQNWLIPNKIYFVIDLLYSLNTLLSKMSKCSWHCKKEPLLIKIPEIFNNEINFRNQNFSIAISVWQKKKKKRKR